jgi:carboxymethylenebutenolidase
MGQFVDLKAQDGTELAAYIAMPAGEPIGALVVVQEIFGVNASIREVADSYAADGFVAIAPALFDRFQKGIQLDYDEAGMKRAFELYALLKPQVSLLDVAAAFSKAKEFHRRVAVLGFCYGGLMSWLSATRGEELKMRPNCVVGYYAGGIGKVADEDPSCSVLLHFGAEDSHIGADQINAVRTAHPDVTIYTYEGADHAFANPYRPPYQAAAARLARERSLEFLKAHMVG